jgi:hypothetical protein
MFMECDEDRNRPSPWSRALLEKLIVTQLVKKFTASYGTRRFVTLHRAMS